MADILTELGYSYGTLNPLWKKKSQPIYTTNSDPLEILRKELRDRFKNDSTKGVTRFKAIVLRVENPIGEDKEAAMSWADQLAQLFGSEEEIRLVAIKAMIPEIHGSILPTPKSLGTEDGVGADHSAINKFPTFTAQNTGVNEPKPGEVVWVTFEDIENLDQGVLLGGLKEGQINNIEEQISTQTARSSFDACGNAIFGASSAKGLSLSKINVDIVGNFPDLQNIRTPVNLEKERGTLPVGKGLFTNLTPSRGKRYPVKIAVEAGLDWVAVLGLWQRWPSVNAKGKKDTVADKEKLRQFVKDFHNAGIRVYLWAYPNLRKLDEMISFIFPLAYETGCLGVIYDPEADMMGKDSKETIARLTKNWMDKSMQQARKYGLCCGVSSYEMPIWFKKLALSSMNGADFVIPQSYRAKAKYKPRGMIIGLQAYKDAGFKNILAMGSTYGGGYETMYPQYAKSPKPPEEIIRRTGWLLGDEAQKRVDYKKALGFWSWETSRVRYAVWPHGRFVTLKNIANELERFKKNPGSTNPPLSTAEKEISDASAAEKKAIDEKVTENVKTSEWSTFVQTAADVTADSIKQSDEASEAKNVKQTPKLSTMQQKKLDAYRQIYEMKRKEVEDLELQIEGLTSTAVKGTPAHAEAEKVKKLLNIKKQELKYAETPLRKYEKKLGILVKTASPSPLPPAVVSPNLSNSATPGCDKSSGRNQGGFQPSSIGFEHIKEYKFDNTIVELLPATPYEENRVRNGAFIQKFLKPELLVKYRGRQVHTLVAKRIELMNQAWVKETGRPKIHLASGIREPGELRYKWLRGRRGKNYPSVKKALERDPNISIKALFDLYLIDEYGSVRAGRTYRAFNSPHETGCAFDIYYKDSTGTIVQPVSKTNSAQRKTKLHIWMMKNAHKFGITPYKGEAWHWEVQLTRKAWYTGEDFVTDGNYAVKVVEKSTKTNRLTNDKIWSGSPFE